MKRHNHELKGFDVIKKYIGHHYKKKKKVEMAQSKNKTVKHDNKQQRKLVKL